MQLAVNSMSYFFDRFFSALSEWEAAFLLPPIHSAHCILCHKKYDITANCNSAYSNITGVVHTQAGHFERLGISNLQIEYFPQAQVPISFAHLCTYRPYMYVRNNCMSAHFSFFISFFRRCFRRVRAKPRKAERNR